MNITHTRSVITARALFRLVLGWGSYLMLGAFGRLLPDPLPGWLLLTMLAAIIAVILACAFGVVHEAERLAARMGDPYGSLVLTLSIVLIEVILISAVMLGPGEHATIARDSVMAVSMIILDLVVGLCLLAGGLRHGMLKPNRSGVSSYLVMLVVLLALAFALPGLIGQAGSYTPGQQVPLVLLSVGLYVFFLVRQMGAQAAEFTEGIPRQAGAAVRETDSRAVPIRRVLARHHREILLRLALLLVTVLPIVLLSHDMAGLLDDGLGRVGAPVALSGLLIAMIVFLPESITSLRAALQGEIQRVSNLCHGALVSTVGLTIPAVLVIGAVTGQPAVLAESPVNLVLLGLSLLVTMAGFGAGRASAVHGAAHLGLFAVYAMVVFT